MDGATPWRLQRYAHHMTCSICKSDFDPADGQFYEWGLTCGPCHDAIQATPEYTNMEAGGDDFGTTVVANAIGLGLMAATGVGFTYGGKKDEPKLIPDPLRLKMAMPAIQARLARERVERRRHAIRLRRGGEVLGPFTMEELAERWEAGQVGPGDEYHYEGMADFLPVSEFKPPS